TDRSHALCHSFFDMCVAGSQLSMHRVNLSCRVVPPMTPVPGRVSTGTSLSFIEGAPGVIPWPRQGPCQQAQPKSTANRSIRLGIELTLSIMQTDQLSHQLSWPSPKAVPDGV